MQERVLVTKEGLQQLKAEYEELVNVRRPETVRAVAAAREEGDLRENAGYHAARHDLGIIDGRIKDLEKMLKNPQLIEESDAGSASGIVRIGSKVTIDIDGELDTYTIVGVVEANPREGRISNESPFGSALLGHHAGETVTITTPATVLKARIVSVE